ncbi:MAG TPA: DNA polymerase III subunit delta [Thermosynechococcaceae cyanobacterium]
MPVFLYWGEDEFAIAQAVKVLRDRVLDVDWSSFNEDKFTSEQPEAIGQALNQAMTPPFGAGSRLVWLVESPLFQRCPEEVLTDLGRTLPNLPETSVLLFTNRSKPDARLKSTKLLQKHAEVREFSLIPPWKTDLLSAQVRRVAQEKGVKLTQAGTELLTEAVGNNTRQLYAELEKLHLYAGDANQPIDSPAITTLVTVSSRSTLHLGSALRQGQTAQALELAADLLRQNEPALRIVSSLVGQFRTWVWVKLMVESGERDEQTIAQSAELANPKRLYFLKQEVAALPLPNLLRTLPLLLELEASLKRGADELATLQTKIVELCEVCRRER